ncbi:MAG: hypothetical protein AAF591_15040 [Verrucomicrobiota bacterium]
MNRRIFNNIAMAAAVSPALLGAKHILGAASGGERDRFGGWTGKKFDATGFFRAEKEDRWWLVTPEGNAFLSFGINHLSPDVFRQKFNREAWQKKLGIDDLDDHMRFAPALRKWFLQICEEYGFNTAGVHNPLPIINRPRPAIAYMQPIKFVDTPHWKTEIPDENFVDVFSDEFAARCDSLAKEFAAPLRDDPYLLGYSMTDCTLFTEEDLRERPDVIGGARRESRIGWPRRLRNLGSDAAGKQAYVEIVRELYQDKIEAFNTIYGMSFDTFDALCAAEDWRPHTDLSNANETRDNVVFLQACVAKYYENARDAIRRYDPNHLFMGDKINANTDSLDTVLPVTSKYTDVLLYQMYARYEVQAPGLDRFARVADLPVINGDSAYTMITDSMPRPYGPVADNLSQRVEWTDEYFRSAFARPEFVGWHYCGLINATNLIERKKDRQHSGLLDSYGEPYSELRESIQQAVRDLYNIATA